MWFWKPQKCPPRLTQHAPQMVVAEHEQNVFLLLFGRFLGPGPRAKNCDLWGQVRGRKIGGTNRGGRDDSAVLTLPRGPKSLASSGTRSRGKASTSAASRGSAVHSSSDLCRTCSAPKSRRRAVVSFKWNQLPKTNNLGDFFVQSPRQPF